MLVWSGDGLVEGDVVTSFTYLTPGFYTTLCVNNVKIEREGSRVGASTKPVEIADIMNSGVSNNEN